MNLVLLLGQISDHGVVDEQVLAYWLRTYLKEADTFDSLEPFASTTLWARERLGQKTESNS